jgi:hypothetical protein
MIFGRAGQQSEVTDVVSPLHQSRRQRWVDPGALGVPRIDRGDSPPARRTCPVEEGSPEPRGCRAAEVGWSDGPAGPASHAILEAAGPTFRRAPLPLAWQAGRRRFGSDRVRRQRWKLETLQGPSALGAGLGI